MIDYVFISFSVVQVYDLSISRVSDHVFSGLADIVVFLSYQGVEPKQGRSRSKSRDTPQPSPLGQQNPSIDWQPPKGKQTKSRQRKAKKSEVKAKDSELERQQQMLQQQLYQQMEQRHRLMQQKQGLFVEHGQQPAPQPTMPLQQPGQQPPVSLQQHMVENPALLAQPPIDVPHTMRPLSHTPDLSQGPPSRPDSQMALPPCTQGSQMTLPPANQVPPGYIQTSDQGSFSQRFPTPEHYLQQFSQQQAHQRKPQVHYVAEANNPFSDQFQELQSKGRGRGGAKKKPGPRKPGKPRGKKAAELAASQVDSVKQECQTNPTVPDQSPQWPVPTPSQLTQAIKQENPEIDEDSLEMPNVQPSAAHAAAHDSVPNVRLEESREKDAAVVQEAKAVDDIPPEQYIETCPIVTTSENASSTSDDASKDTNVTNRESTPSGDTSAPAEEDADESVDKSARSCNGTGLEALQKLESMVADMANEEEACKELEKQTELERWPLDDDEYDPEMDKIYDGDFMETFERSLVSPAKVVGNGSQANSVASLECHEESLISPLLEETERRKERQKFFAEVSSNDSVSLEKNASDVTRNESGSKQQDEGMMSCNLSDPSDATPCDVTNPSSDERVGQIANSGEPSFDQTKSLRESEKDPLTDSTGNQLSECHSDRTDHNHGTQVEASAHNVPQGKDHCHDSLASQMFGTAVSSLPQSKCESSETTIPPVNVVAEVDETRSGSSGNGGIPLAPEAQRTPETETFESSAPQSICEAILPCDAANVASSIAPEAVHDTVSQIPKPLDHFHSSHLQEPVPSNPIRPAQREKPAKTSKATSRPKSQHSSGEGSVKKRPSPKEDDPLKKQIQELRRQEYERKKREYEEQQKKKRELQKELRIQKQMIREQRKRQKIYMNANNRKQKTNFENSTASLKLSTPNNTHRDVKPATPLSLCEPKLLLTLALTHPYGSRPVNGQCLLKGNFGSAKVDGMVDYYSQFPSPDMDIVVGHPPTPPSSLPPSPRVHQQQNDSSGRPLVNGDVSAEERQRDELLTMTKPNAHGQDSEHPAKRARYISTLESSRSGVSVPPSMPTPPLSDSAATVNDRLVEVISSAKQRSNAHTERNGKESNSSSSSTSPETVQYIASSSPESDAVNRVQTPKFSALLQRDSTDSPTFPAVTIKREQLEHFLDNGVPRSCSQSCSNVSDTNYVHTTCKLEALQTTRIENDADDLDSINVTLTLSPTSEQRVTDTVASVADLIGCSPPRRADIVIEPAGKGFSTKGFMMPHSLATTTGDSGNSSVAPRPHTSSDIYQKNPFPCSKLDLSPSEETSSRKKPEGPYCRHCDVLIIGIGVKRKQDEEETVKTAVTVDSNRESDVADYKIYGVNVEAGDCTGDIFCAEACLKQYFAHLGSACSSPTRECRSGSAAEQPRLDATVTSMGQTSVGAGNVTSVSAVDTRGALIAEGLSPTSLQKMRSPSWKEEDEDEEVRRCNYL